MKIFDAPNFKIILRLSLSFHRHGHIFHEFKLSKLDEENNSENQSSYYPDIFKSKWEKLFWGPNQSMTPEVVMLSIDKLSTSPVVSKVQLMLEKLSSQKRLITAKSSHFSQTLHLTLSSDETLQDKTT